MPAQPAAAADDARSIEIACRPLALVGNAVRRPFPDVSDRVVEPERIGFERTNRCRVGMAVTAPQIVFLRRFLHPKDYGRGYASLR